MLWRPTDASDRGGAVRRTCGASGTRRSWGVSRAGVLAADHTGSVHWPSAESGWGLPGRGGTQSGGAQGAEETDLFAEQRPVLRGAGAPATESDQAIGGGARRQVGNRQSGALEVARARGQAARWHHRLDARHPGQSEGVPAKRDPETRPGLSAGDAGCGDLAYRPARCWVGRWGHAAASIRGSRRCFAP